ncbi:multicopper oxidase domain-containing protein [Methylicorpusculum sp.]|uniref:multicopper oxidase domain-containing protein n=1 Tax=Methylicorpusculum sp. TaxID=2713644 RepID=UPI0027269876|nr:multicopper oxidase domain-containing protein [Methylicorpusculum sp.]MDO8846283.1 multicopper oxidase domain-containing protein [Methylicorpusculum sp.]
MKKTYFLLISALIPILIVIAVYLTPTQQQKAGINPPGTLIGIAGETSGAEKPCSNEHPEWREAQVIDGVSIEASQLCEPDNPYDIAASVKGVNNLSMHSLMQTHMAQDALTKTDDLDGDGDPDVIHIKLEVIELNGATPEGEFLINTFDIAPGIQPGLWVYAPKSVGMGVKNFNSTVANPMLRAPSPVIRVEQGDKVMITLENTHYLPHTIHLHGVDHPWHTANGDNDGGEEHPVFPGKSHTYEIQTRHAGTMFYHCHVQTAQHFAMGLNGMIVVEENRPNNWVQTFNIGAGQVRHPSVAVKETADQEYDLYYQSVDKRLAQIIQNANDPRLIAHRMSREYNITESFENYFMLNGRSFPYTLRESLIVAGENEKIKLRLANAQRSSVAVHFHGHKAAITAYDGVDAPAGLQITRDVFDIAPAQRIDLLLKTVNDGLNSYGPGLWMFHDHVETGTTTDGMEPGGNMSILAYKHLLDEQGMPTMHDAVFDQVFNKNYYAKKKAVWGEGDFAHFLGEAGQFAPDYLLIIAFGLACGLAIGLAIFLVIVLKRRNAQ